MIAYVFAALAVAAPILRMGVDVSEYGLRGTGTILVDRDTGRFIRTFRVGPASDGDGFDGKMEWMSDAGNAVYPQRNRDTRALIRAWSHLLQRFGTRSVPHTIRLRVGEGSETITLGDMRRFGTGFIPFSITVRDSQGLRVIHVRSVDTQTNVSARSFTPPILPHDFGIRAHLPVTRVPLLSERLGTRSLPLLVVSATVAGQRMRFLVDTGGQNVLSNSAARKLHLRTSGTIRVGGAGSGTVAASFATVRSFGIGDAYLRDQSFLVLPLETLLPDIDGVVGAELFARFAIRVNYEQQTLDLATVTPRTWALRSSISPIAFDKNTPELNGSIDAIPGEFTLDTGSIGGLDINAPFATTHRLYRRHFAVSGGHITGVGGSIRTESLPLAKMQLGRIAISNVTARLAYAGGGVTDDPTIAGNIGETLFRRYRSIIFDYRDGVFAVGGAKTFKGRASGQ